MTIQWCQGELHLVRKLTYVEQTDRKYKHRRTFWTSKTYPNKQKQGLQKKIKIHLPQHPKKQEKMTTKSKLEKKYKYSEMSLIQMSRLKWSDI